MSASEYRKSLEWFALPHFRFHEFDFLLNFPRKVVSPPQVTLKFEFRLLTWNFVQIMPLLGQVHSESFTFFGCFCRKIRILKSSIVRKSKFCSYIRISRENRLEKMKLFQWPSSKKSIIYVKFQVETRKSTFNIIWGGLYELLLKNSVTNLFLRNLTTKRS